MSQVKFRWADNFNRLLPRIRLLIAIGCGTLTARAQESAAPTQGVEIASASLLKSAPDFSQWTVSYSYPADSKSSVKIRDGHEPLKVTTTQTKHIIREEAVDAKGRRAEAWYVGSTQYRKAFGDAAWYISTPQDNPDRPPDPEYSPLPPNGFRDWSWVGQSSYVGPIVFEGVTCLVFAPSGAAKLDHSNPQRIKEQTSTQPLVAYVNVETRLPQALRTGDVIRRYQFLPPPTAVQQLSPDLAAQIKKVEEGRARLYQPAPRPY